MVILVGGDGGRRAIRVGSLVALILLVTGLVLGRYAQIEVLGIETQFAPPAALVVSDGGDDVTLRTTPGDRDVAVTTLPSGTVVGVVDDHGSWLRVEDLGGGELGWVRGEEVQRTALAVMGTAHCPVPVHGAVGGPANAVVRPGAEVELVDAHRGSDGSVWVGVRIAALPGIGLLPQTSLATHTPANGEDTCAPITVDPTVAGHQH